MSFQKILEKYRQISFNQRDKGDKFERLKNLLASGHTPEHESIEDSFKDLANYCIIAMMVNRGKWPENK